MAFAYGHYATYEKERYANYSWLRSRGLFPSAAYSIVAASGTYGLTGQDATLTAGGPRSIVASMGAYTLSGGDAGLTYVPVISDFWIKHPASAATWTNIAASGSGIWEDRTRNATTWTDL